ncbi:hypothetical protein BFP72_10485 [Reichenbachiella sp. 5M10]|uniref:DUF6265 family protein n=1 Tax=Reichenbachiella sp. 5M10 TaxID=1889772 RepID=UPI000C15EC8E|nr:DUF6265 family protein [Reichenbachiella sp. 5M10]PIB35790.1 hypothetical protein BFP72_10485 [Reichenbachiella sp. 5M10]
MKQFVILLFAISTLSCNSNHKETQNTLTDSITRTDNTEHFDWLLGQWQRLNEEEGKETYEYWHKVSDTEYTGLGFTMQASDTIWQEQMRLVKHDKNWNLTIQSPGESVPTTFKGTAHSATEFTCTNNEISFPNRITYWSSNDRLFATVDGGDLSLSFEFEKTGSR